MQLPTLLHQWTLGSIVGIYINVFFVLLVKAPLHIIKGLYDNDRNRLTVLEYSLFELLRYPVQSGTASARYKFVAHLGAINTMLHRLTWTKESSDKFTGYWLGKEFSNALGVRNSNAYVVLYLHGGAMAFGDYSTWCPAQNMIRKAFGARELGWCSLDYPVTFNGARYPQQTDAALAAYQHMIDHGINPKRIILSGDSAGANIALSLTLQLPKHNLPPPAGVALLCPWLALDQVHFSTTASRDYVTREWLDDAAKAYIGDNTTNSLQDPLVSPLYAKYDTTFPPLYAIYGGEETLRCQTEALAAKVKQSGLHITTATDERMFHDYALNADVIGHAGILAHQHLVTWMKRVYAGDITSKSQSVSDIIDSRSSTQSKAKHL